ncbi:MAG: hypothetical protein A2138_17475 [Deltaproteobacteria bacterium RBG_16_71_12]|nr:MAG: hypothetical protein A2138_17475 [Deltaproteobacteria bacterium RBG_16_71_12]
MHEPACHLPTSPMQLSDPVRAERRRGPRLVRARRHARIAASVPLYVAFALLVLDAITVDSTPAVLILAGGWCAATMLYCAVLVGSWLLPSPLPASALARELGAGSALERNALVLPLVAVALVGPLSIHGAVSLLLGCGPGPIGFDEWVMASLIIVGHAHLVFAILVGRFGAMLADDVPPMSAKRTLLWTTVTAGVPGVLLYAIPPVLTALTGAVLLATMYAWARRTLVAERVLLVR